MYSSKITKEEQLREESITAAQKLFQQYGLHKTTMEDIAKAMGRGKSTLYYYYKKWLLKKQFSKKRNILNYSVCVDDYIVAF